MRFARFHRVVRWAAGVAACLLFRFMAAFADLPPREQSSLPGAGQAVRIYSWTVQSENNWEYPYSFPVSVLGLEDAGEFVPLLAIALEPPAAGSPGTDRWLAVWNLSEIPPRWHQRVRALLPAPGLSAIRRQSKGEAAADRLLKPMLTATDAEGPWEKRVSRTVIRKAAGWGWLTSLAQIPLRSYLHFCDDLDERRFLRLYTLIRMYEEVALRHPAADRLSPAGLLDLKWQLLRNRRLLGPLVPRESKAEVVERYESQMRTQAGMTASFLHSQAALYGLNCRELSFGIPGQVPLARAVLLSVHSSAQGGPHAPWPGRNPFDLRYNPFAHPQVRQWLNQNPDEDVPLAIYVLCSDFHLKPVLAVDFFDPDNVGARQSSALLRILLEHCAAVTGIPWSFRVFKDLGSFAIRKKDVSWFSLASTASGVESVRLFAALRWGMDTDLSQQLARSLDRLVANPLALASTQQTRVAVRQFHRLVNSREEHLSTLLRRIFEDRIRREFRLGSRAIYRPDYQAYQVQRRLDWARHTVEEFVRTSSPPGIDWDRVLAAWESWSGSGLADGEGSRIRFLRRLDSLYPEEVPEVFRPTVSRLLSEAPLARIAGGRIAP